MIAPTNGRQWPSVDEVVEAYEAARARNGQVDLADFVPDADHPLYLAILCELVRVELEYSWHDGRPKRMDHYRARFPELFRDGKWVQEIAFEEYRQRRQAGEDPSPLEYRRRFGADTIDWPSSFLDSLEPNNGDGTADHGNSPSSFPPAGSTFLGFHLHSETWPRGLRSRLPCAPGRPGQPTRCAQDLDGLAPRDPDACPATAHQYCSDLLGPPQWISSGRLHALPWVRHSCPCADGVKAARDSAGFRRRFAQ